MDSLENLQKGFVFLATFLARGLEALGIEAELPDQVRVHSFLVTPSKTIPVKAPWPCDKAG